MKKTSWLSLATAAAIVATSAGTFAAWDTMKDTETTTLTLRNPVETKVGSLSKVTETGNIGIENKAPVYATSSTFTVANAPDTGYKLVPTVKVLNGENDNTDKFTITGLSEITTELNKVGGHVVNIEITPNDNDDAKSLAGTVLTVEVTGTLTKNP